jgi:hypothetical protein
MTGEAELPVEGFRLAGGGEVDPYGVAVAEPVEQPEHDRAGVPATPARRVGHHADDVADPPVAGVGAGEPPLDRADAARGETAGAACAAAVRVMSSMLL